MTRDHVDTKNPTLKSLDAPLGKWIELNESLEKEWRNVGDIPWWYGERALLSVFAGALWCTGGKAFEEFGNPKRSRNDRSEVSGRIDLWLELKSGAEFDAEAKLKSIPITRSADQRRQLEDLMKDAKKAARRITTGKGERLAIAFAAPYLTAKTKPKTRKARIAEFQTLLFDIDYDAIAWTFPNIELSDDGDGYIVPGIVVWFKIV